MFFCYRRADHRDLHSFPTRRSSDLPVHVPFDALTETNVVPAGSGSATFTFVSTSGPLFVTTIVHVMSPLPSVCDAGEPVFVTARSTLNAHDSLALTGSGSFALPVVSVAVLSYTEHSVSEVCATTCTA